MRNHTKKGGDWKIRCKNRYEGDFLVLREHNGTAHANIFESLNEMNHFLRKHKFLNLSQKEVKKKISVMTSKEESKPVSKNCFLPRRLSG